MYDALSLYLFLLHSWPFLNAFKAWIKKANKAYAQKVTVAKGVI